MDIPTRVHVITHHVLSVACYTDIKMSIMTLFIVSDCRDIHHIQARTSISIWFSDMNNVPPSGSPFIDPSMSLS